ncbi:MAG: hypothetical protein H6918_09425 [Sphingomonadaceae bacterium]|nr:hypothetical protein [Sphingomonadaceae bacterium]
MQTSSTCCWRASIAMAQVAAKREPLDLAQLAAKVVGNYRASHTVALTRSEACMVRGDSEHSSRH